MESGVLLQRHSSVTNESITSTVNSDDYWLAHSEFVGDGPQGSACRKFFGAEPGYLDGEDRRGLVMFFCMSNPYRFPEVGHLYQRCRMCGRSFRIEKARVTAKRAGKFCTLKYYHQAWHAFSDALANDRGIFAQK
jgi:hypothetical protein